MHPLVKKVEAKHMKKKMPRFDVGDTVKVHTKIVEGDKERIQIYQGTVVARRGSGISETFTVNRVAFGYANEKVFPIHGPSTVNVEVIKRGDVRRAKLNYLRGQVGKKAKVRSKFGLGDQSEQVFVAEEEALVPEAEAKAEIPTEENQSETPEQES